MPDAEDTQYLADLTMQAEAELPPEHADYGLLVAALRAFGFPVEAVQPATLRYEDGVANSRNAYVTFPTPHFEHEGITLIVDESLERFILDYETTIATPGYLRLRVEVTPAVDDHPGPVFMGFRSSVEGSLHYLHTFGGLPESTQAQVKDQNQRMHAFGAWLSDEWLRHTRPS